MSKFIGLLTAVRGTAIPLTVVNAFAEGDATSYECVYTVNGEVKRTNVLDDALIGFGDSLIYSNGCFVDAYFADTSDDDEDDEDDEEEDDEDDEDEAPADHDALKNT